MGPALLEVPVTSQMPTSGFGASRLWSQDLNPAWPLTVRVAFSKPLPFPQPVSLSKLGIIMTSCL